MNIKASETFGEYYVRLPLRKSASWYIRAAQYMKEKNFMEPAAGTSIEQPLRRTLVQDKDMQQTKAAFVSTNSISQGEQVGILWNELFNKYKIKIHFAFNSFSYKVYVARYFGEICPLQKKNYYHK